MSTNKSPTVELGFHVYDDPDFGWHVGYEQSVGCGSGVRIAYFEKDRAEKDSPHIDIVATPAVLREIAKAINRIADAQEVGS